MTRGPKRLYDALRSTVRPPQAAEPGPSDAWGAWVEYRLAQIETWQTWMIRLLIGSLAVQVGLRLLDYLR